MANYPAGGTSATLAIIILIATIVSTTAQRSSYGEPCNKTLRCESRSWQACLSGKCACIKPDEMIFEPNKGKCASKSGERCKYALERSDGSFAYEFTNCVENAICGEDGFCACTEDYYENTNGTCSLKGRYSETCDDQVKCSELSALFCNNGTCDCDGKVSTYEDDETQCVGLVDHTCVGSKCTKNSLCLKNKCVCEADFYPNHDGKCSKKKNILERCSNDDQCKREEGLMLKCVEGVCNCDPDVSLYGSARKHRKRNYCDYYSNDANYIEFEGDSAAQCLGKVGAPCINALCGPGSFCRYNDPCHQYDFQGTCSCLPNYIPTGSGTCGVGYGGTCQTADVCIDEMVCNANTNKCECRYTNQHYDENKRKCTSPVERPCNDMTLCADGAECQKFRNRSHGTCQCKPGYVEGAGGSCFATFGLSCSSSSPPCDQMAGLQCLEFTCQCREFQQFSRKLQKCVGLVGADCNLKAENECVENTRCVTIRDGLDGGRCRCNPGFTSSTNYTCENVTMTESIPILAFPAAFDESSEEDYTDLKKIISGPVQ